MKKMCFFILLFPMIISAQSISDYIPLEVGNYWIQHSDIFQGGNNPVNFTMEIEGIDQIDDLDYMRRFNSFETDDGLFIASWWTWLRETEDGIDLGAFGHEPNITDSTTIFNPPLLWFSNELLTPGNTYQINIPEIGGEYNFTAEEFEPEITVPAGTFTNCLHISLIIIPSGGNPNQTSDFYFAEDVGEIRDITMNNIFGDFNLDLVEYNVQTSSPQIVMTLENCYLYNYPNPFNPDTIIYFSVKENETAQLSIFNTKGQIIETETFEAGEYNFNWDASSFSSGQYFYRLESDSYSQVKKMTLIK